MEQRICPYLAVLDDPTTCKNFPYEGHACYRVKKPVLVKLSYQRSHCLNETHTLCAGYINGWETGFPNFLRGDKNPVLNKALSKLRAWREKTQKKETEKVKSETKQAPIAVETDKSQHIEVEKVKPKIEQAPIAVDTGKSQQHIEAEKIKPKAERAPIAVETEKPAAIKDVQKKRDWSKALTASFAVLKGQINDGIKSLGAKLKGQKEKAKKPSFIKSLQSKLATIRLAKKEEKSAVKPRQKTIIISKEEKTKIPDRAEIIQQDIAPSSVQLIDVEKKQQIPKETYQQPIQEKVTCEKPNLSKEYNLRDELKSQRREKNP